MLISDCMVQPNHEKYENEYMYPMNINEFTVIDKLIQPSLASRSKCYTGYNKQTKQHVTLITVYY